MAEMNGRELALPLASAESGGNQDDSTSAAPVGRGIRRNITFDYEPPTTIPYPGPIGWLRRHLFRIFLISVWVGTIIFLVYKYFLIKPHDWPTWKIWLEELKVASIPVVSVCFTWWHVWLGLQMCWYPVEFCGIPPCLGWQGIVPRRAHVMAERSCDIMIGNLITIEEIIDRIEPEDFFSKLDHVIGEVSSCVLARMALKHWPSVWAKLPDSVKQELKQKIVEESQGMFRPVIEDIKENVNQIFDIKQMAIDSLCEDKAMLVDMFQKIGSREFTFVLHVAAVMGFVCGGIQLTLWMVLGNQWWLLPVSGLIIGYFTNWLAITMIFRPVNPHIICGGYVNIQGVFLKRQAQVSKELTTMICDNLVYARRMLEYVIKQPNFQQVLNIYQRHMDDAFNNVLGRAAMVAPLFVGPGALEDLKAEVVEVSLDELPKHSKDIEEYMDATFNLKDTIAPRLRGLPPEEFEGMLHPVFQEDEWMVLLLGGVLGILVGSLQTVVLGS